jgi:pimeloyl-ACP methyl ester carboxylesterase
MKGISATLITSITVSLLLLSVGCGSEDGTTEPGGSLDAGTDGALDGALDGGHDGAGHDGAEETGQSVLDASQDGSDAQLESDAEASDPACLVVDPYPSTLKNPESLEEAQGELRFVARDGNVLTAYIHRSATFVAETGRIVFVMHGAGRNASGYLDAWRDRVEKHGALALAPEFPTSLYPSSEAYNLGVGTAGTPYGDTYDPSDWRDPNDISHSEIEHLFEAVREVLGNESCRYSIYGHSAGGQFVHRLLTFRPDARVARAVAANSGWYALPSDGGGSDPNFFMPYGLQGAPPDPGRLPKLFGHDLVVLLGEDDVVRDDDLRKTAQADAQGLNRFERGHFYFSVAQQGALSAGAAFRWTLDTVPGVAHSNAGMTPAAAAYIFGP